VPWCSPRLNQSPRYTLYYLVEADGIFTPSAEASALRPWPLDALPPELPAGQRRALALLE
jgi:hypothetical protein